MNIRILHFYPDLMNLYGSYANIPVLRRILERAGYSITVETVNPGENVPDISLNNADFIYMGAGMERRQKMVMEDFTRYAGEIKAAASDGVTMLFAGNALELLGSTVTDSAGHTWNGIALADFSVTQRTRRITGDVCGHTDLYPETVVGFMNKSGIVSGIQTPLLSSLEMGFGNDSERGAEGFHKNNVFASELTGPLLVKNPELLTVLASGILTRRGESVPETLTPDEWAVKGYNVTARELQLRAKALH